MNNKPTPAPNREILQGPTPNGGAYSITYYFDIKYKPTVKDQAAHAITHEYDENGRSLRRSYQDFVREEPEQMIAPAAPASPKPAANVQRPAFIPNTTQKAAQNNGQRPSPSNGQKPSVQNNGQKGAQANGQKNAPAQGNGQKSAPAQGNGQKPNGQRNDRRDFRPHRDKPRTDRPQGEKPAEPSQAPKSQSDKQD